MKFEFDRPLNGFKAPTAFPVSRGFHGYGRQNSLVHGFEPHIKEELLPRGHMDKTLAQLVRDDDLSLPFAHLAGAMFQVANIFLVHGLFHRISLTDSAGL